MKKILKTPEPPQALTRFVTRHPVGTPLHKWNSARHAKKAIQCQLYRDQRGLCAYCEIDMTFTPPHLSSEAPVGDIHIEHFHPESDTSQDWAFMWTNMLAVCMGGAQTNLSDENKCRIATGATKTDNYHCDVPKADNVLDGIILNPLEIKTTKSLFSIAERPILNGNTVVDTAIDLEPIKTVCDTESQDCYQKARETISRLHLNCDLLGKFRHAAIEKIKTQQHELMKQGHSFEESTELLVTQYFDNTPDSDGNRPNWPPFFTTIRAYLGSFVEDRLAEIEYEG